MSKLVAVKLNGKDYQFPEGMNLIAAAESVGIHIPNFCYLEGMKGIGACRMCLVESSGRTMTACTMRAKDGLDIVTDNEKIAELRKFVVDLILSMHPLDCMTCTKAGVCDLQNYAYNFEIQESTFTRKKFGFPIDEANPFIKRDPDYCILCGRCVRVCGEQDTNVLEFMGRGVGSKVATADDKPLQDSGCTFCGSCVDACPVNALLEADRWRKGREWDYERFSSVCLSCGNACDITISTYEGDVAKIRAGAENGRVEHYICAIGRYGFDCIKSHSRVFTPMKRVSGKLEETTWEDALKLAADKLGGGDAGIVATGGLTNEDALVLNSFAEKANLPIDTSVSLYGDEASLLGEEVDLENADLMIVAGLNPSQWDRVLPALDAIVRKKVDRKAKLIIVNSDTVKLSEAADLSFIGDEISTLKSLAQALIDKGIEAPQGLDLSGASVSEEIEKAAEMYEKAANPVVIAAPSLYEASQNIAVIKGKALSMPIEANAKGVLLMGLKGKGKTYSEMSKGGVAALYSIGEVPLSKRPDVDFLIVQSSYMTDLAREADILLPSATFHEIEGSLVDFLGRLRYLNRAIDPAGEAKGHKEIISELAKTMNIAVQEPSETDI